MEKQLSISTEQEQKCTVAPVPASLVKASMGMYEYAYRDCDTMDSLMATINHHLLEECTLYSPAEMEEVDGYIIVQINISSETSHKLLDRVINMYKTFGKYSDVDWYVDEPETTKTHLHGDLGDAEEPEFMKINFYFKP